MSDREFEIELTWQCSSCSGQNRGRDMACSQCGNPKEERETYEMPADVAAAPAVTDPRLLEARAGANWRCRFCGSSARARSGACAQCGAGEEGERPAPPQALRFQPARAPSAWRTSAWRMPLIIGSGVVAAVIALAVVATAGLRSSRSSSMGPSPQPVVVAPAPPSFHDADASTSGARYVHSIEVERWRLVEREGFAEAKPADAVDPREKGERVHHHERVQQGTRTETYTDHESRSETETYTDRERCGEDCRTTPKSCRRDCTNSRNGFARCKDVCTGGDRKCEPRYCNKTKTRTVTKRVPVSKTRQVPNYVQVPRRAMYYAWKAWDWRPERSITKQGDGYQTVWPDAAEVALGSNLGPGEKERERRVANYTISLTADDGGRHTLGVGSLDQFQAFEGARCRIRVHDSGRIELVSGPERIALPTASSSSVAPSASSAGHP